MKEHDEIRSMLAALAGGDLSPTERDLVEQHLAVCQDCRAELALLQMVVQTARSTPDLEPPPWLATRIMARVRIEAVPQQSWFARLFLPLKIKLPMEAFALVMICVTAWYVMQEVDRSQQVPPDSAPIKTPVDGPASNVAVKAVPSLTVPVPAPATPVASQSPPGQIAQPGAPEAQRPAAQVLLPSQQAALDRAERMDRVKAGAVAVPAAPAVGLEQAAGSTAAMAERRMAPGRKATNSDTRLGATVHQPLRLRLVANDRATFSEKLHVVVQSLEGTVIESRPNKVLLRIKAAHLPELMDQIAQMGQISERPVVESQYDGWLELHIFW